MYLSVVVSWQRYNWAWVSDSGFIVVIGALLEKCLNAPVAGGLWYRFFEPVPRKWSLWYRVN